LASAATQQRPAGNRSACLPNGQSVCDLRLAVNDQKDQPALFVDVATFGKSADACAECLSKGRQVAVTGRLVYHEWETKDGNRRSKHSVVGRVSFGGKPDGEGHAGDE
jgi:single-strand DNA-binding protein